VVLSTMVILFPRHIGTQRKFPSQGLWGRAVPKKMKKINYFIKLLIRCQ